MVNNTLPKLEFIAYSDWWWTGSCEYADLVFGVASWAEFKQPDMTASVTNPFLQVFPRTPLPRIFDTKGDAEAVALDGTRYEIAGVGVTVRGGAVGVPQPAAARSAAQATARSPFAHGNRRCRRPWPGR